MRFHAARLPLLIAFVLLLAGIAPGLAAQSSPRYDVLIRGGTVVDGAVILREAIAEYASVAGREVSPRIRMFSLIGVIEDRPGNLSDR